MSIGFAGSKNIDERRRRRLAQEGMEAPSSESSGCALTQVAAKVYGIEEDRRVYAIRQLSLVGLTLIGEKPAVARTVEVRGLDQPADPRELRVDLSRVSSDDSAG